MIKTRQTFTGETIQVFTSKVESNVLLSGFFWYFINKLAYCMLYLTPHSSTILQNSLLKISAYHLVNSSGLTFVFVCRPFLNLPRGIDLVLLMWTMQMTMQGHTLLALYVGRVIAPPCQQQTVKEPLKYLCLLLDYTAKGESSKLCFMHPSIGNCLASVMVW